MKSLFAFLRNVVTVAALVSSSVCVPAARAASSGAVGSDYLSSAAHRQGGAAGVSAYPFEFHSGFWINLHHFLYEQALLRKQVAAGVAAKAKAELSAEQQKAWDAAVDYYAGALAKRDLLMDDGMVTINDRLAEAEGAADLSKSGLSAELIRVLEGVAPIYRAQWWPKHDRANRFWIAVATPLVQQFGRTSVTRLAAAFKAKWPGGPVRVDVVEYASWAGAYTTLGRRVHCTVSSFEYDNQGFSALETLFHEASHSMVGPNRGAVAEAIARECKAKNKPIPRGLWHAIIFYTVGDVTKRNLSEYGVGDYTPFAYRGLYARAWPNLQRPLELYWQPYLDGSVDFDKAVSNIIAAL
jgi:hypothetical protein